MWVAKIVLVKGANLVSMEPKRFQKIKMENSWCKKSYKRVFIPLLPFISISKIVHGTCSECENKLSWLDPTLFIPRRDFQALQTLLGCFLCLLGEKFNVGLIKTAQSYMKRPRSSILKQTGQAFDHSGEGHEFDLCWPYLGSVPFMSSSFGSNESKLFEFSF